MNEKIIAMEVVLLLLMIGSGGAVALALLLARAAAREAPEPPRGSSAPPREIAGSILHAVARSGGATADEGAALVRAHWEDAALLEPQIDIRSWAEAFARGCDEPECRELLEASVRLAVAMNAAIPLAQYNALLDVCFGLGFHADALARLRADHRFTWVDHAKNARPVSADRRPLGAALFRRPVDRGRLLATLELDADADHSTIVSAYRRLASRYHPDRYWAASEAEREQASRRFIEVTEAYEQLLASEPAEGARAY